MTERHIQIAVAWADIIICAAGRVLSIAAPVLGAALLWAVMKCHGR